ncbi:MAG: BatD family protein [Bacteroidota bacterium]
MLVSLLGLVMWGLLVGAPRAQVAVSAYADKNVVDVGETVLFIVEVTGEEPTGALLPPRPSSNLRLLSRTPALRERTSFGAQLQVRYGWRYRAERPGVARLGSMRLQIGGQAYTTDPIPVDIVRRRAPAAPSPQGVPSPSPVREGDLVVRAEPRKTSAVVGEQIIVDYVLYFDPARLSPRQAVAVGTWDAPGFWREELDVPSRETYPRSVTFGGRSMQAVTVRRLALFPARAGSLELAAMEYEVEVREMDTRDPFAPFFRPFSSRRSDREVVAPSTIIEVEPLPTGAPETFAGAVGDFDMVARVDPVSVEPGEAVFLALTMRGTGNAATLAAPDAPAPDGVDAYAPQSERSADRQRLPFRSSRTFTYTFVPQGASFEIPEIVWSYFDPEAGEYVTLREGPFPITVTGGVLAAASTSRETARWQRSGGVSAGALWGLLAVGVTLPAVAGLGLIGARAVRTRRERQRTPDAALSLTSAPDRPARERAADVGTFVRDSLASSFGPEVRMLPRTRLVARVAEAGRPEIAEVLGRILADVERSQFAGAPLPEETEQVARDAIARL